MLDFGLHLKELRTAHGYTQAQLSQKLHVTVATVIRWEHNYKYPEIETLIQLAQLYHVTLDFIAGVEKNKMIVTNHLTQRQFTILQSVISELESCHAEAHSGCLNPQQRTLLNNILLEFDEKIADAAR